MKIYVACLAAYNSGILHGAWINAAQSADEIRAEIDEMLADSPVPGAEEWAIHDYELGGISIGEYESLKSVAAIAQAMDELSEQEQEAFVAWWEDCVLLDYSTGDELLEGFRSEYQGCFKDIEDYAHHFIDETGLLSEVPDSIKIYFDYEEYGRDMLQGNAWVHKSGPSSCHVFIKG